MDIASARIQLLEKISRVTISGFEHLALEVFRFQAQQNPLYANFLQLLSIDASRVDRLSRIPFLPIQFFKKQDIKTGAWDPQVVFTSSGTSGATTSYHPVRDKSWYEKNARRGFEQYYGNLSNYCILALLPSYLERQGSSLVYMADFFIRQSRYQESDFFLYNTGKLIEVIKKCQKEQIPVLLLGVSFALLDLAEQHPMNLDGLIVMETGGMKGRRKEITREQLHTILQGAFELPAIHSEYGMTELLSQAYSRGGGRFLPAPSMRVLTREISDPLALQQPGRTGVINVIDLANLDSISFIATDDLGVVYEDHSFEVLGRLDASDLRGCNLLIGE